MWRSAQLAAALAAWAERQQCGTRAETPQRVGAPKQPRRCSAAARNHMARRARFWRSIGRSSSLAPAAKRRARRAPESRAREDDPRPPLRTAHACLGPPDPRRSTPRGGTRRKRPTTRCPSSSSTRTRRSSTSPRLASRAPSSVSLPLSPPSLPLAPPPAAADFVCHSARRRLCRRLCHRLCRRLVPRPAFGCLPTALTRSLLPCSAQVKRKHLMPLTAANFPELCRDCELDVRRHACARARTTLPLASLPTCHMSVGVPTSHRPLVPPGGLSPRHQGVL